MFVPERLPLLVAAVGGPGREVLDLGCRTGAVTTSFLAGNRVVGMDVDREALAIAEQRGIETVWGDIEAPLPFEDASFDAVVAGELLEHVREPADVVAEVRRLLRPGGTFAGSVPNAYRFQDRLRFMCGQPPDLDPTHLHMYSPTRHARRCCRSSMTSGSSSSAAGTGRCTPVCSRATSSFARTR